MDREDLERLQKAMRPLVAALASTDEMPLTEKDVDFVPQGYELGTHSPPLAIEIRTMGFPTRKAKFTREAVEWLKAAVIELLPEHQHYRPRKPEDPLIWIQFIDPDGVHV